MLGVSAAAPPHMWKEQASPHVACYPCGQTVGRRDRSRIGAVCPYVRLVSGAATLMPKASTAAKPRTVAPYPRGATPNPCVVSERLLSTSTPAPTGLLNVAWPPMGGDHPASAAFAAVIAWKRDACGSC